MDRPDEGFPPFKWPVATAGIHEWAWYFGYLSGTIPIDLG
jgi:hypothetical protein